MEEEFLTVEKAIEPILLNDPFTRADDMLLYLEYLRSIGAAGDLAAVLSDHKYRIAYSIAPYETVSRVRRKLQERHECLRPSKDYIEYRRKNEKEFRKYARKTRKNLKSIGV